MSWKFSLFLTLNHAIIIIVLVQRGRIRFQKSDSVSMAQKMSKTVSDVWTNPTHLPKRSRVVGLLRSGSVLSKAPIKPRVFGSLQNKSAAVSLPALLPNYISDFIFVLFNSAAIFFCRACICLARTECMCEKQSALTVLRFARRVFGFVRSCAAVFSQSISLPAATTRSHCLCSESRNYSLSFSSWQFW